MQQSIIPKDLLDIIFNFCNIETKRELKKLCKLTYWSYNFVCGDPLFCQGTIDCKVKYNNKTIDSFIFQQHGKISKNSIIFRVYNKLIDKYKLDKNDIIKFGMIWDNEIIEYSVRNDNLLLKNQQMKILSDNVIKNNKNKFRKFCLIIKNKKVGRFIGNKPKQAASKAFNSLVKKYRKENINDNFIKDFTIQEITKGCEHKFYYYFGESKKLEKPVMVNIRGGQQITYNIENIIKKRKPNYRIYIKN